MIRFAAAALYNVERFLLSNRPTHKAQSRFWKFPCSTIELGETAQVALARGLVKELR